MKESDGFFRMLRSRVKKPEWRKGFWFWFRVLAFFPLLLTAGVLGILFYYSLTLPSLEKLERIEPALVSKVYDKDSALVHEFFIQRRIWTPVARIPQRQLEAVFAIEDQSFARHWGVDLSAYPPAVLPALWGGRARGASTLTQQLAKNLFLSPERSVGRKVRELMVAVKIEQTYTKREILEFYFNQVYLGAGAYGFQAAAQKYFSRPLDSLGLSENALLAGLLQRPEAYRPDHHPEACRDRRNTVLRAMRSRGFIGRREMTAALAEPVRTRVWLPPENYSAYFIETLRQFMEKKWNEDFIYNQGVSVYSTLDRRLQQVAESTLTAELRKVQIRIKYATARKLGLPQLFRVKVDSVVRGWDRFYPRFESLYVQPERMAAQKAKARGEEFKRKYPDTALYRHAQGALVLIDNETGAVRALVGGEDFEASKYNRALQALRSPGSAFKPFVYAAAVDNGASPGEMVLDQPITIPDPVDSQKVWRPHNYEDEFEGPITLRRALYRSKNLPAIQVGMKYGLKTVVGYARRFGLKHEVPPVPALGIGAAEATVLEMTSAYTAFPNLGVRPEPYFIESIEDKGGMPVYRNRPATHEVLRPEAAWILCTMLRDVNIRGTAAGVWASGFNWPSGGKTGTTNDYTDAWYVGFTRRYTCGVWVGADNHMPMGSGHTGADDALPTWLTVMRAASKGRRALDRAEDFPRPPGVVEARACPVSGLLAQGFCPPSQPDYFIAGHEPGEPCRPDYHRNPDAPDLFEGSRRRDRPSAPAAHPRKAEKRARNTF